MNNSSINKENRQIELITILLPAALCFLWILYSPLEMLFGNEIDLAYNMYTLLGYMFPLFAAGTLCLSGFLRLVEKKSSRAYRICTAVIAGCLAASYFQGTYMTGNLPPLDGREIRWSVYTKEMLISAVVWLAVLAGFFVLSHVMTAERWNKFITSFATVILLISAVVILIICISSEGYHRQNGILQSDTYLFDMSEKENLVILLLDSVDGAEFREVTEKHPEYAEILEDFTSFDNVMSGYPYTSRSIPFILSGRWYENEQPYRNYCTEAFTQSPLFEKLRNDGYRMGFYDPDYSFVIELEDMFENISKAPFFASPLRFISLQMKLTGYRYFPFVFKRFCAVTPGEISAATLRSNGIEGYYSWENEFFLEKLETKEVVVTEEKCFRYIYLYGAHVPFIYPAQSPDYEDCSFESSMEMCMTLTERYLQKLKSSGVYDSTAIVILSDHGYADDDAAEGRQHPFLLIKGRHEKHPYAVNSAPLSHEDLQEAFLKLLDGAESSELFPWEEGSERNRRYLFCRYGAEDTLEEFYQTGSADSLESMEPTGRVYILN